MDHCAMFVAFTCKNHCFQIQTYYNPLHSPLVQDGGFPRAVFIYVKTQWLIALSKL